MGAVDAQVMATIGWRLVGAEVARLVGAADVDSGTGRVVEMFPRVRHGLTRLGPEPESSALDARPHLLLRERGVDDVHIAS